MEEQVQVDGALVLAAAQLGQGARLAHPTAALLEEFLPDRKLVSFRPLQQRVDGFFLGHPGALGRHAHRMAPGVPVDGAWVDAGAAGGSPAQR